MNALFSIAYWLAFMTVALVLYLGALILWLATAPFDPTRALLHRYTCWWAVMYLRWIPGCRISVEGREHIQPGTPYILASNHQSIADIMALSALAVPFKWVSKKETFRIPFVGWNMKLNRYVRVDRGNLRRVAQTMAECRRWLGLRWPLLMFPEGHRSPDGQLIKFHNGAFKLALECQCAVVPIVVQGTRGIYHRWRVNWHPGPIRIRVLAPVAPEEFGQRADQFRDRVFALMRETLDAMRREACSPLDRPAQLGESPTQAAIESRERQVGAVHEKQEGLLRQ